MRMSRVRRSAVLTLSTAAMLAASGCFGSFNLVRKVYGFNKTVSTDKFVRELVFLGMNIVPIYGVAGFIDVVVANTVEFWTGTNPIQMTRTQVDSTTSVAGVIFEKDGMRILTLKAFDHDTLVSATTMRRADGSNQVSVRTVLADGRTVSEVLAMRPDSSASVVSDSTTAQTRAAGQAP